MFPRFFIPFVSFVLLAGVPAAAQFGAGVADSGADASVRAVVSPSTVAPGQPATFQVIITGSAGTVGMPKTPDVRGLEFGNNSVERNFSLIDGVPTNRIIINFPVVAPEEGTYTVPGITLSSDDFELTTNEVTLTVEEGADPNAALRPFVEIEVAKTEFYIGERIPITLTVFAHRHAPVRQVGLPEIKSEDFAVKRFPQNPDQSYTEIEGSLYKTLTYRSTLTPIKAGALELGPAEVDCYVMMPTNRLGGSRGVFAPPTETRQYHEISNTLPLNILPLPEEGRPDDFEGTVGTFSLEMQAGPSSLKVGDPISVELLIRGRGNFESITAPALVDPSGWLTYDARMAVEPTRDLAEENRVVYTQMIRPEIVQAELPTYRFSFFDPEKRAYVILETPPSPITVIPNDSAPPIAVAPGEVGREPAPGPEPDPVVEELPNIPTDIVHILPLSDEGATVGRAPHRRGAFVAANTGLGLLAIGALALGFFRTRAPKSVSSTEVELRAILADLDRRDLPEAEFVARAQRAYDIVEGSEVAHRDDVADAHEKLAYAGQSEGADAVPRKAIADALQAALKKMVKNGPTVIALLVFAIALVPTDSRADLSAAVEAYEASDFEAAAAGFEKAIADGNEDPDLFFNLGNAAYRQGDAGRAALWYRRAESLAGGHPEAAQNLRVLRAATGTDEPDRSPWQAFTGFLMPATWVWLAAGLFWAAVLWIILAVVRGRSLLPPLAISITLLLPLAIVATIAYRSALYRSVGGDEAIAIVATKAYSTPASTGVPVRNLLPGASVRLLNSRGDWHYVEVDDRTRAWARADEVEPVAMGE